MAVVALLVAAGLATPAVAQSREQVFDIPAQAAGDALIQLCLAADCELAIVGPVSARTHAVRGRMSWRAAMGRMLEGTDLRYRFVGERGVRIWAEVRPVRPATPMPSAPAEPTELAPIVVVGRLSEQIDAALRRKREADVISDSITAARLGDLPAANLAEALQRMPGVAIEREVGEGQFVSVRGLGPLFQSVTLNGAPVAFNENIRNSTQSGRQFRFRALSPDLLAGARLTKSSTPDLIEGGIGSNIDIETVGGLDGAPFLSLRLGGATEQRTGQFRQEASVAGRHLSQGGDWGVVAGLSEEARSVVYDRFQIQRYRDVVVGGQTVAAPTDVRTTVEQEDRLRRSAFLGADLRVSDALTLDLDALVSTFDNAIREDRLVYSLGERLAYPDATATIQNGVVTGARIVDGQIDNNTEISDQAHLNVVVSAGVVARLGDWRLAPRISLSEARSDLDTPLERISAQAPAGVGYIVDLNGAADLRRAAMLDTNFDLLDPSSLTLKRLGVRAISSVDDDLTVLMDARRPVSWSLAGVRVSGLRLGGQVSDRNRDYQRRDREAALRPGWAATSDFHSVRTPDDVFRDIIDVSDGRWVAADFGLIRRAFILPGEADGVVVRPDDLAPTGADLQNSYRVGEGVAAAYVRFDIDGEIWGAPVFGDFGVRMIRTRTDVEGALMALGDAGNAEVRSIAYSGTHEVVLPSFNLAFDLDEGQMLRLAWSRTLTRPSLADLRAATVPASTLVSAVYERGQAELDDPSPWTIFTGIGGNPALKPYVSTNYDVSWEWSVPRGALSIAAFHKRIDDFIQILEAPETLIFETRAGPAVQAEVMMSRPRNVGEATVTGLEIGVHRRFAMGVGLWANLTVTDSRAGSGDARLTGVSDVSWSVSPFYERGPFAMNLSWSWRSAFRSEADLQGGGVSAFTVASAGYLDAQASLDIGPNAQLIVSGSNLTDTVDLAYDRTPDRLLQLGRVGPSASISLRWGF